MNDAVLLKKEDGVAVVTLNRPDKLNSVTAEIRAGLREKLDDACKDDDVKVIVLTGAGRGFCAGADMDGLANTSQGKSREEIVPEERDYAKNDVEGFDGGFSYFPTLPKPVIALLMVLQLAWDSLWLFIAISGLPKRVLSLQVPFLKEA